MIRSEFTALMEQHYQSIKGINSTKGADYAGNDDALSNFKRQAANLGLSAEQVLAVYMGKHIDAVMTYCREGQVESEPIEGRIHDVILYCFLLLGLVEESNPKEVLLESIQSKDKTADTPVLTIEEAQALEERQRRLGKKMPDLNRIAEEVDKHYSTKYTASPVKKEPGDVSYRNVQRYVEPNVSLHGDAE